MLNPFFKNVGPFDIKKLLANTEVENKENFKKDKIYNVSDLASASNKDVVKLNSNSLMYTKFLSRLIITLFIFIPALSN